MALKFRRVKKAFGFDKTKTEKYVVVPERATPVEFGYLCEQIALVSGVNKGMVRATLYGLVSSMKTFIQQGILCRWKDSGVSSRLLTPRVALWKVKRMRIPSER